MTDPAEPADPPGQDDLAGRFETHRARLFGAAYRMTGSVSDAEDCVQDAFLRWTASERADVLNDEAYLVRVVSRLAIDRLRATERRKAAYVGPWLPDPLENSLAEDDGDDPQHRAELADSLTFAFLVVLDRLTPSERVAFVLHDVFGVPFDEVAVTLEREPEACRKLASRAREKLRGAEPRSMAPDPSIMAPLLGALAAGDIETCLSHLAPDVILTSDAGPNRRAARHHVVGSHRVVRLLSNLFARSAHSIRSIRPATVNGAAGVLMEHPDGPILVTAGVNESGLIDQVWIVMNPDKFRGVRRDE